MATLKKWIFAVINIFILICLFPSMSWAASIGNEIAANMRIMDEGDIVVGNGVTATFDEKTGEVVFYSDGGTLWYSWIKKLGLSKDAIKSIKCSDSSGIVYLPKYSDFLFNGCSNLKSLDLSNFDASKAVNMFGMFYECSSLTSLDLRGFDTSNVTDMCFMFYECSSLTSLDLSNFDTSKVTTMSKMFSGCSSLSSLDLRRFNTSNVTDMSFMFYKCSSLTSLDMSNFDTSKVTNMGGMFAGCSGLTSLDLRGFDTSNDTDMCFVFFGCSSLTSLDLNNFDTSKVTNMKGMFSGCSSLTSLNLNSFNTSNVTNMGMMFSFMHSLTSLDLSGFNTLNVSDMTYMFEFANGMTSLDLSGFDISNADMSCMLGECVNLRILKTPMKNSGKECALPFTMYDETGNQYSVLPKLSKSILLARTPKIASGIFTDVTDMSSWYFDPVYWAVDNDVTSGMGEGTFQPMANLTRAQAVMFLHKLAGRPNESGYPELAFTDVKDDSWYYKAVRWAVAKGITSGYGEGTFKPNVTCNRAMIVTFLMRYSKLAGTYTAPAAHASFKDVPEDAWYREAVDWAVASGVTTGYGEGTFQPMRTCNRAMMVTFLKRTAELPKVSVS